jgi:hypothetical protein
MRQSHSQTQAQDEQAQAQQNVEEAAFLATQTR